MTYWAQGVGQVARRLNRQRRGNVIAAWNGLFFNFTGQGPTATASHLTPIALHGKVYDWNIGNYRWTFGVQYRNGKPCFKTLHLPDHAALAREFDFAAGAAQCLIREGRPLRVQPYPHPGDALPHRPVRSNPDEAGYIPIVDHMKTSRTSMGWTRDNRRFYLLFVRATHTETESGLAFKGRAAPITDGWALTDEQRFWQALGVWGAINSDGGEPAQMVYRLPAGTYMLVPPRWTGNQRRIVSADFPDAPAGGTLLTFYIRVSNER